MAHIPPPQPPAPMPCTIAAGTLRIMGLHACHYCGGSVNQHAEYAPAIAPHCPDAATADGQPQQGVPYGQPQHSAAWGAADGAPAAGAPVESETRTASCLSLGETGSVILGWTLTLGAWLHLLVIIPYCETHKGEAPDYHVPRMCRGYYGNRNSYDANYSYSPAAFIVMSICIVSLWIQSLLAPTRRYLSNVLAEGVEAFVRDLIAQHPTIVWHIQCYHYETEYYTDSEGKRQSRQRRVDTHSATSNFMYDRWRDMSGAVVGSIAAPVRRLRSEKEYRFADRHTQELHDSEFAAFIAANDLDTHKSVSNELHIDGFRDYALAYPLGEKPFGFDLVGYTVLSFLTLSTPFRMYFYARTTPVDFHCVKEIRRL